MLKTILRLTMVSVLVLAVQACTFPGAVTPTLNPNAIRTAIARTASAAETLTSEPGIPVTGHESPTPSVTPYPTFTPLSSPTPLPTFTPVVTTPQVSVSVSTNCRVGPGTAYTRIGGLLVGEVARVIGRNATGTYWIIENPDRSGTCWLWGQYATVSSITSNLPVFTAPPLPPTATPSPQFDVAYEGLENCTATGWWVDLGLENLGGISFRSVTFTIEDRDTDVTLTRFADGFVDRNGCNDTSTRDTLSPGVSATVSSPVLTSDPTGHRLRATITLCSNIGQNGTCVTQSVNMTP